MKSTFVLTKDGKFLFSGTENECYIKLQRTQSQSADWAIKFEGYKVEEIIGMHVVIKTNAYVFASNNSSVMKNFLKENEGKILKVETEYFFNNQYNTTDGYRIYDTMVQEMLNDERGGKISLHDGISEFTPDNTFFLKHPKGLPVTKILPSSVDKEAIKFGTYYLESYPSLDYFRLYNCKQTINFKYDGTHFFEQSIGWNQKKSLPIPAKELTKLKTFLNAII